MLIEKTHLEVTVDTIDRNNLLSAYGGFYGFVKALRLKYGDCLGYYAFCGAEVVQTVNKSNESMSKKALFSNVLYHLSCLSLQHKPIYYISPDLAVTLSQTDLDVDTHFFRLPFPEVYFQIEPGLFFIKDSEVPDKIQSVKGFYVNQMEAGLIRVMVVAYGSSVKDDSLFYFKIPIGPGKIKAQLRLFLKTILTDNKEELEESKGLSNIGVVEELFLFIFNCVLYLTCRDAEIVKQFPETAVGNKKNKSKIQKVLKRQEKYTNLPIYIVGHRKESTLLPQVQKAGGVGKWKLLQKVYVSGHWKVQWYGSEKDKTRKQELIFIKPYEKGPDLTEVLDKTYIVKG